ncbi:MAG TPA: adenylyl-sulfate kinase, partial [Rhodobiaceae bacterium]|nr:adenylyl-sulfate kinase [Rhodobiaceae bacterium]
FSGLISSGKICTGDAVRIVPSGRNTTIKEIVTQDGALSEAVAGQSVTLTFDDEIDCSRGDVIALADNPPAIADRFEATLVWMSEDALIPRRAYWL